VAAVAIGGQIWLIGVLTGFAGVVPTSELMRKHARLQGLIVGSRSQQMDFVRAIDATGLKPVVDRTFPLDRIADAFRLEESGGHFAKICLEY
jgi:NADPH:quinone reductase-like Zn-dependent oxidoreductase